VVASVSEYSGRSLTRQSARRKISLSIARGSDRSAMLSGRAKIQLGLRPERRRVLDFATLICSFLGGNRAAVQTELARFLAVLRNQAELARCASAQALSEARQTLPHAVFTDLTRHLLSSLNSTSSYRAGMVCV
jgi:hypothetical protein